MAFNITWYWYLCNEVHDASPKRVFRHSLENVEPVRLEKEVTRKLLFTRECLTLFDCFWRPVVGQDKQSPTSPTLCDLNNRTGNVTLFRWSTRPVSNRISNTWNSSRYTAIGMLNGQTLGQHICSNEPVYDHSKIAMEQRLSRNDILPPCRHHCPCRGIRKKRSTK